MPCKLKAPAACDRLSSGQGLGKSLDSLFLNILRLLPFKGLGFRDSGWGLGSGGAVSS